MGIPELYSQHCKSKTNTSCPYIMHRDCQNTCNYVKQIGGLFVGSKLGPLDTSDDSGLGTLLNKIEDEQTPGIE